MLIHLYLASFIGLYHNLVINTHSYVRNCLQFSSWFNSPIYFTSSILVLPNKNQQLISFNQTLTTRLQFFFFFKDIFLNWEQIDIWINILVIALPLCETLINRDWLDLTAELENIFPWVRGYSRFRCIYADHCMETCMVWRVHVLFSCNSHLLYSFTWGRNIYNI